MPSNLGLLCDHTVLISAYHTPDATSGLTSWSSTIVLITHNNIIVRPITIYDIFTVHLQDNPPDVTPLKNDQAQTSHHTAQDEQHTYPPSSQATQRQPELDPTQPMAYVLLDPSLQGRLGH